MRLHWRDLGTPRADRADGKSVELAGFPLTALVDADRRSFADDGRARLLRGLRARQSAGRGRGLRRPAAEARHRRSCASPGPGASRPTATAGATSSMAPSVKRGVTRRALLAASPLFCLPVPAMAQVRRHGGRHPQPRRQSDPDELRSRQLRAGGRADAPGRRVGDLPRRRVRFADHQTEDGRLRPGRDPRPGELYDFSQRVFPAAPCAGARSRGCRFSARRRSCAPRASSGRRSSSRRKAPTSSRAGSSASTRPTSAGHCAICSSRTIGRTSWATSRPSPACMAG